MSIYNELEEHNEFFNDLVDMIPAKLYVVGGNHTNTDQSFPSKYQKGQNKESKESKWAKAKAGKMKKFDPYQQESTREKKKRLEQKAADESGDDDSKGDMQFEDKEEKEVQIKSPSTACATDKYKSSSHESRIEDLKANLRAKLAERKTDRVNNGVSDTMISKRAGRRAEKNRRVEAAKKNQAQQKLAGGTTTLTGKNGLVTINIVKELGGSKIDTDSKLTTVIDDLYSISFGGIAGLKDDLHTTGSYSAVNKSLNNMDKKKSLGQLFEEAEAKKERLRELKVSDDIEGKAKTKKMVGGDALKSRMGQGNGKMDERQSVHKKQRAIGGNAGANLSGKRIKDAEGGSGTGNKNKRSRLGPNGGPKRVVLLD